MEPNQPRMSDIKLSRSLQEQIASATTAAEVTELMHEAARTQGIIQTTSDGYDVATEPQAQPRSFAARVTVGGESLLIEAATPAELDAKVAEVTRGALESQPLTADVRAELELNFKRGSVSAAEYLTRSGLVEDYLAKRGVPIEAIRDSIGERANDAVSSGEWARATERFLASPAGADWPGGQHNLEIIGMKIAELGLTSAEDKFQALCDAYEAMKASGTIFESADPQAELSRDASPEQLLEAWKNGVRVTGQDEGSAFSSLFGKR
jgi:hypothetical protein